MIDEINAVFDSLKDEEYIKTATYFFKKDNSKDGNIENDQFYGIKVPVIRKLAKKYYNIDMKDVIYFIQSPIHEKRMFGLFILVEKYKKTDNKKEIVDLYLNNTKYINNWDLVDLSADVIIGDYVFSTGEKDIVYKLAKSDILWEKRIAVISTQFIITKCQFDFPLEIIKMNLTDKRDLMHKANGWMLREIWKRDLNTAEKFIINNYKDIPRTTLRYAIEKMDKDKKGAFLKGTFI